MVKSDVYQAIIKIKEHCDKQKNCEECDLFMDTWDDDEETCILNGCPTVWNTEGLEEEECPKEI